MNVLKEIKDHVFNNLCLTLPKDQFHAKDYPTFSTDHINMIYKELTNVQLVVLPKQTLVLSIGKEVSKDGILYQWYIDGQYCINLVYHTETERNNISISENYVLTHNEEYTNLHDALSYIKYLINNLQ